MKGASNIVSSLHHLKMADEHFESFQREHPASKGARTFHQYRRKIAWIFGDIATHPFLPEPVRKGIKNEINSDVFAVPAIQEKIPLLTPEKREFVETVVDMLLDNRAFQLLERG